MVHDAGANDGEWFAGERRINRSNSLRPHFTRPNEVQKYPRGESCENVSGRSCCTGSKNRVGESDGSIAALGCTIVSSVTDTSTVLYHSRLAF